MALYSDGQVVEGVGVAGVVLTKQFASDLHGLSARTDPFRILSLPVKCVLEPVQSIRFLEPRRWSGVIAARRSRSAQCPAGVADSPFLLVRLPLADGEHFREGFTSLPPSPHASLAIPPVISSESDHVLVQLAAAFARVAASSFPAIAVPPRPACRLGPAWSPPPSSGRVPRASWLVSASESLDAETGPGG